MSNDQSSIEKAVRETVIGPGMFGGETSAEQLDLLRDGDSGDLPNNIFPLVRRKGPGRPAGSGNKVTKKIAQLICQTHGDPVMELASLGFMPLDQMVAAQWYATGLGDTETRLHKMLDRVEREIAQKDLDKDTRQELRELSESLLQSITKIASKKVDLARHALTIKKDALKETATYTHGKQPITVHQTGKADVILNIPGLTDPAHLAEYAEGGEFSEEDFDLIEDTKFLTVDPAEDE